MTQILTDLVKRERIITAIKEAVVIQGGPVGYREVSRRARELEPQSLERWMRDLAVHDPRVRREGRGLYTVRDLGKINALGRFVI